MNMETGVDFVQIPEPVFWGAIRELEEDIDRIRREEETREEERIEEERALLPFYMGVYVDLLA